MTDRFIQYISDERRYSEHTIKAYQNDLQSFVTFLSNEYELNNPIVATQDMIRSWVVNLIEENITARSVNRKISSLKSYFKFLQKSGDIEQNPASTITTLKIPKRLPSYIEKDQINSYLDSPSEEINFYDFRNRLIVDLLYSSGIRRAELIGIKNTDVDLAGRRIKVLGKRNKERIIPLSEQMVDTIQNYLVLREDTFKNQSPYLIVTNKGNQAYPEFILRIVNKELSGMTAAKKSPHILRHTFATHMLNNGADINVIKELLGHADLAATQVYTHNTIEQLKTIYTKAHPRAKFKKGG